MQVFLGSVSGAFFGTLSQSRLWPCQYRMLWTYVGRHSQLVSLYPGMPAAFMQAKPPIVLTT